LPSASDSPEARPPAKSDIRTIVGDSSLTR